MAIQFARAKRGKRMSGANACHKGAYNAREKIKDEKTGKIYDYRSRGGLVHHEVILPEGADKSFKNLHYLWNVVEARENRKDSQVYKEYVIALPDNKEISDEMRIELSKRFVDAVAGKYGFIAQLDVHRADKNDNNNHAHVAVCERGLLKDSNSRSQI